MKKRIFSMALALIMMLSICAVSVGAEDTTPYEKIWLEENFDDTAIFSTAVTKWYKAGFNDSEMSSYRGTKYAVTTANVYDYWANRGEAPIVVVTEGGLAGDAEGDQAMKMTVDASNSDAYLTVGNYAFTEKTVGNRYGLNIIEYDFMLSGDGVLTKYSIDLARAAVRIVDGKITLEGNNYVTNVSVERDKAYRFKMAYNVTGTSGFKMHEVSLTEIATGTENIIIKEPVGLTLRSATYMHFPGSYPCSIGFKSATLESGSVDFYLDNFKHYRMQSAETDTVDTAKTYKYTATMPQATNAYAYTRFGTFDEYGLKSGVFANNGSFHIAWEVRRQDSTSLIESPFGTGNAVKLLSSTGSSSYIRYVPEALGDIASGYNYTGTKVRVLEFDVNLDLADTVTSTTGLSPIYLPYGLFYISGEGYDIKNRTFELRLCRGKANSSQSIANLPLGENNHIKIVFSLSDTTDPDFETDGYCRSVTVYVNGKRVSDDSNVIGDYLVDSSCLNSFNDSARTATVFGKSFTDTDYFLYFGTAQTATAGNGSQIIILDNIEYYGISYDDNAESTLLNSSNSKVADDTALAAGTYGAEVILTRKDNETATSVFAALYKKDGDTVTLEDVKIKNVTFSGNLTAKSFLFTDFEVPEITGTEEYFIKTFVLDGSGNLNPVRNSVQLGK